MQQDLQYLDLSEVSTLLKTGDASPVELTKQMLARIKELNPQLNAYVCVLEESALAEADRAEHEIARGIDRGALHGVPVAVKDIFDIEGVPTTAGMGIRKDAVAREDATVIRRLRDAGAIILGKLSLTEGVYAEHRAPFGVPRNPWNEAYWPGASSSGSAVAVAAGLCYAALASETGGSLRLPSAANGVTGIKPTWGRVSRHGTFELAATLDHVSTMARTAADAAAILEVIAGADQADPTASQVPVPQFAKEFTQDLRGLRIGVDESWLGAKLDEATSSAMSSAIWALRDLGAEIVNVTVPDVTDMIWDWFPVCAVQTAIAHEAYYPSQKDAYGPALVTLLEQGRALSGLDYQRLLLRRQVFTGNLAALFSNVDMLALPVLANGVPSIERMTNMDDELIADLHRFTCPFNMAGVPSIVLPCGVSSNGMPLVFQLAGAHFSEAMLVNAGNAFQRVTAWHTSHPAL
jgi:amidase